MWQVGGGGGKVKCDTLWQGGGEGKKYWKKRVILYGQPLSQIMTNLFIHK